MYRLSQKLFAEFIGTFAIVFFSAGVICADASLRSSNSRALGPLSIALAYGLAVAMMTFALGNISGAHFNPAITIGFWATKKLGTITSILYCAAQLLGSIAGAYLLGAIIPEPLWRPVALGVTDLASDITRMPAMGIEAALTFFVVFIFALAAVDRDGKFQKPGSFAVGFAITVGTLLGGPFTGAAMNPARVFGPAIVARHWTNQGIYWIGPLLGGLIAACIADVFLGREA